MKPLQMVMTSNLQSQIAPDLVGKLLALLMPLFARQPYDMFVIKSDKSGKLQIRLAGYSFVTNELDEETIISQTDLSGNRTIWFKVDDYGDRYVGTLLLPEDY
ncbi:MAG: hypothetical protein P9L97_11980 [Candidatus Tenebribacter davisii]|nr:hypothetical protein [Candidatus Tenebribacter davisii]